MLRVALTRLSKPSGRFLLHGPISTPIRLFRSTHPRLANPDHHKMINYALYNARSKKSDESYADSFRILEQFLTNQFQGGADDDDAKGLGLLALSTLLSERGNIDEAIQTLLRIQDLTNCSLATRVPAIEALVGLNLEMGLDDTSSVLIDNGLKRLEKETQHIRDGSGSEVLIARAKAVKGLVELVQNDLDAANTLFLGCEDEGCTGNAALSYGELLHVKRDFAAAKELYLRIISELKDKKDDDDPNKMAACNMVAQEVLLGATCALGQLQSHMGSFGEAELTLTNALNIAEEYFGADHPKVGTVLTCIAVMYGYKAAAERSSSLLIQEGLYRKALNLLKVLPLEKEVGAIETVEKRDIVALARGGYSETLCVQENRKPEGERMKIWAEAAWRNRRLSIAEALDISEPSSKVPVIDTRICRAL